MSAIADPICPHCNVDSETISIDMHDHLMFDGDQVQAYVGHTCYECDEEFTVIWNMTIHTVEVEA